MIAIATTAGVYYWQFTGESDALRKIVLEQCVPNQLQNQNPAPCAKVKPEAGYVVFKDRNGPLQYLLMPTYRINGTESPLLTDPERLISSGWPAGAWFYEREIRQADPRPRSFTGD